MKLKKIFMSALAALTVCSSFSMINTASAGDWKTSDVFTITDVSGTKGYTAVGYVESGDEIIGNVTEISYNVNLLWVKGRSKSIGSNLGHRIAIETSRDKSGTYESAVDSTTIYTDTYLKGDWFTLQGSAQIGE
ncbi:MAG: hypothetical protein E7510_11650 [Ruminococcus sp.]|nr:hypothetical protein [Ruminococcus sp.]